MCSITKYILFCLMSTSFLNFQKYCLVLYFATSIKVPLWSKSVIKIINYAYCPECVYGVIICAKETPRFRASTTLENSCYDVYGSIVPTINKFYMYWLIRDV